ncbi:MAG: hypothetical protein LUI06_05170 [Ruminococcus sp.]|nr:hypothetical protein [Ruminococcus sp.]
MALIVNPVMAPIDLGCDEVIERARKLCGISLSSIKRADIHKTSLDARRRSNIHFVHSVYFELLDQSEELRICKSNKLCKLAAATNIIPVIGTKKRTGRVVVAGFGPAGMFCALMLAKHGYRPIVLEKGADVDKRTQLTERFWKTGSLDTSSNVQFGEGGAGTFSDGKLTTRIKDPNCRYVLEEFVRAGADESILTKAKPHIGTDKLKAVVKNIREQIISLGGEVRFETPLKAINMHNRSVSSVVTDDGDISCSALVIACGHSAEDTFLLLENSGVALEPKPFSVGVRIEHTQRSVNESLYGEQADNPLLPVGEYQLSHRTAQGRAVYTFCMCPGGAVVPASSEEGGLVTNGMSEFARDGENANSAVVVSVSPEDYGNNAFDGFRFAKRIERASYQAAGRYTAPATTLGGFLSGKPTLNGASVNPTYCLGVAPYELRRLFPDYVSSTLEEGFRVFARKMHCFSDMGAVLTAPETRTSSPIRLPRNNLGVTERADNLYPCGEGAGYAGGIMSAATDGINIALKIMQCFAPGEDS